MHPRLKDNIAEALKDGAAASFALSFLTLVGIVAAARLRCNLKARQYDPKALSVELL